MRKFKFLGLICGLLLMPSFISLVSLSNNSNISEASAADSSWTEPVTYNITEYGRVVTIENQTIENQTIDKSAYTFNITSAHCAIHFNNVTFRNIVCSSYGSCAYFNLNGKYKTTLTIYFNNCKFTNCNNTSGYAGAIYIAGQTTINNPSNIYFNNCYAETCSAKYGGFLYSYCSGPNFIASNTLIRNCQSSSDGGAMYIQYGTSVSGFTFVNNHSQGSGGAIISDVSDLKINNCYFYENEVYDYGGAIYIKSGCKNNTIENCLFYNNKQNKYEELKYDIYDYQPAIKKNLTFLCDSNCSIKDHIYNGEKDVENCNHCRFSDLSLSKESDEKYHISNQLDWLKFYSDAKFNNKTFDNETVVLENSVIAYGMVGSYSERKPFKGTFLGKNLTVYFAQSSYFHDEYSGLFGYLENATVKDLKLGAFVASPGGHSGGLAGKVVKSKIDRVENYLKINSSDGTYVGGIAGTLDEGSTITNSSNYGVVRAEKNVGGIVGQLNDTSSVYNCKNYGSITAHIGTSGNIVGYCTSTDGIFSCRIFNCYCTDTTNDFVGYGAQKNVKNCYLYGFTSQSEILNYLNEGILNPLEVFGTNVNVDEWLFWLLNQNEFQFGERYIDVGFDVAYKRSTYTYKRVPLDANLVLSTTLTSGLYFVENNLTIDNQIVIQGDVKLVIARDVTLEVKNGIYVKEGNVFSLYTTDLGINDGILKVTSKTVDMAGIGSSKEEKCGIINIHGCSIEVKGGEYSAGIGTGSHGLGGNLNVYHGTIKATGGKFGAGIGGGHEAQGIITNVFNGHVEGYSGDGYYDRLNGSGIGGGGYYIDDKQIKGAITNIYNGYIYGDSKNMRTKGIQDPLSIMHCNHTFYVSDYSTVMSVTATSETETHILKTKHELVRPRFNDNNELVSYGIKPYYECECGRCYESYNDGVLSNMITTSIDYWKEHEGRIGNIPIEVKITDGPNTKIINWNAYREFPYEDYLLPALVNDSVFLYWEYKDGNDWYKFNRDKVISSSIQINAKRMSKEEIHNAAKTDITTATDGKIGPGVYTINTTDRTDLQNRLEVNDWAVIALPDDCDLRFVAGIHIPINTTLAIIDDGVKGNGRLQANSNKNWNFAAIDNGTGGLVTIYGGIVTAYGPSWGAAIGGGYNYGNGPIIIYGGTITACGTGTGAGLGASDHGIGGKIVIYGGNIYATSEYGNGIGFGSTSGRESDQADIKIYGGVIHASSSDKPAIQGKLTLPENIKMYDSDGNIIIPPSGKRDVYIRPTPVETIPTCSQPGHRAYYYNSVYYYLDP
ncbi:MAG: hypothetical protein MJ225_04185, partial [Bacilli bacterium]|nr:hypothetical protein [Bacilli bacterium]